MGPRDVPRFVDRAAGAVSGAEAGVQVRVVKSSCVRKSGTRKNAPRLLTMNLVSGPVGGQSSIVATYSQECGYDGCSGPKRGTAYECECGKSIRDAAADIGLDVGMGNEGDMILS